MKLLKYLLPIFLFCASSAFAAPPSDASIKQLLTVSEARKVVDNVLGQIEGRMSQFTQQAARGQQVTPEQQKAIGKMNSRISALLRDELSWVKMEPIYIKLYKETFSQEEVDGIIAFYKTPSGQAMIKKMPLLVQNSLLETQNRLRIMQPKLQQIQKEFADEIQALQSKQQNKK